MPVNRPWITLILSLIAIAIVGSGARFITVESDYEIFFDGVNPRLASHYEIEDLFGRNDFLQLAIKPKSGDVFNVEVMAAVEDITARFWTLPHSRRVDSITNYPYTYVEGDDLNTTPMFEWADELSEEQWQIRKEFALNNVATRRLVVAEDGKMTGVNATIMLPEGDTAAPISLGTEFEEMVEVLRADYPQLDFYPYGSILINKAFFTHATAEFAQLLAIGVALLLITSGIILRSPLAAISIGTLMSASVVAGMGSTGWLGLPLTAPSSSSPVIVMALSVASTIHLMSGFLKRLNAGADRASAIRSAMSENLKPIFFTAVTTAIGFLCLNISDVPPYRLLGNTTALGVGIAFILTFTLLPALLRVLPFQRRQQSPDPSTKASGDGWRRFGQCVAAHPGKTLLLSLVVMAIIILPIQFNVIDDRLLTYFDKEVPIRSNTDYVMENFSWFYGAFMPVSTEEGSSVTSPDYLKALDGFLTWSREQPEVKAAGGFSDVIKQLNQNMNADDPAFYTIPDNQELIAQYLLLYELSLPFGKDLSTQIDSARTSSLVRVGFNDLSSVEMRGFEHRAEEYMQEHFPPAMRSKLTGPPMLFAHIWNDATMSNLMGMGLAMLVICSLIGVMLGSAKIGVISLLPNIMPALMAFGVWGLLNGQIDIGSSIVAVIAFGIIVDDTIHFLHRYRHFRLNGDSYEEAIASTFAAVGGALFTTTAVLALGFGVLAFSNFTLNSSMGMLTGITIVLALIVDFIFLPAFLGVVDRRNPV
jgi:predicted RND superfamily exporter protein